MGDCIFCKIVKGEIPCYKVYEDDNFLAFLDIAPKNKGHTLVIPKGHYRWVWDVEDVGAYYSVVGRIANAMRAALDTDFVLSLVIGEEVPHAHVWLVPRYDDDGHGAVLDFTVKRDVPADEMAEIAKMIAEKL